MGNILQQIFDTGVLCIGCTHGLAKTTSKTRIGN